MEPVTAPFAIYAGRRILIDEGPARIAHLYYAMQDNGHILSEDGYFYDKDQSRMLRQIKIGDIVRLHSPLHLDQNSHMELTGYKMAGRNLLLRGATPDDELAQQLHSLWVMEDSAAAAYKTMLVSPEAGGALADATRVITEALRRIPKDRRLRMILVLFENVINR